jgi:hypothetical protein
MASVKRLFALSAFVAFSALADDGGWVTAQTQPILIKTRARPGTDVREVWAEGTLAAPTVDIQDAVTDVKRFTQFMPYMVEARQLASPGPDGGIYVYSRIDVPVLDARDFVHLSYTDRDAHTDPEGVFQNHWSAVDGKVPHKPNVVRLKMSEGSWLVQPLPGGDKSHVIYRFAVDPGGAVPGWVANKSNTGGAGDTFKNVEKEAKRRQAERLTPASGSAAKGTPPPHP